MGCLQARDCHRTFRHIFSKELVLVHQILLENLQVSIFGLQASKLQFRIPVSMEHLSEATLKQACCIEKLTGLILQVWIQPKTLNLAMDVD